MYIDISWQHYNIHYSMTCCREDSFCIKNVCADMSRHVRSCLKMQIHKLYPLNHLNWSCVFYYIGNSIRLIDIESHLHKLLKS